jgi:anti-anti-sigma regulatory factor
MQRTLQWSVSTANNETRAIITGDITEKSGFSELLPDLSGAVVLDLLGVKQVNSAGVKEWIHFINAVREKGVSLALERCSVPIVHQLNLWGQFRGGAEVRSVQAPYFCATCSAEHGKLIDLTSNAPIDFDEAPPCPTCGTAMEFDDLPEQFFSFRSV